jgi:hypothetical protein
MHFSVFRSAREETDHVSLAREQGSVEQRVETDAVYFSRRAREELRAGIEAGTRKARRSHLDLAQAYEARAHLFTNSIRGLAHNRLW